MSSKLPRDRWVAPSPDGNVTPGGKALEALYAIRSHLDGRVVETDEGTNILREIEQIIDQVNLGGSS